MRFNLFLGVLILACSWSCIHDDAERADQKEKEAAATRKSTAFTGTYLDIPPRTILTNLESFEFKGIAPLSFRTSNTKQVYCQLFRKQVTVGVKRLYRLPEGSKFLVVGVESDVPLDQGDQRGKPPVRKSGSLLMLATEDPQGKQQYFGIGCARIGENIPEEAIKAEALRASFDSPIFKDVEIVP